MNPWLIETFGSSDLDRAVLYLLLMSAPVWLGMLFFPARRPVIVLANPFVAPLLYLPVLFYILWVAREQSLLPSLTLAADYRTTSKFARHPIVFLSLLCKLQILNLTVGTLIYQRARASGMRAPVEIILAWITGPVALLPFSLRLLFRQMAGRFK